jgi:hypothetical protein
LDSNSSGTWKSHLIPALPPPSTPERKEKGDKEKVEREKDKSDKEKSEKSDREKGEKDKVVKSDNKDDDQTLNVPCPATRAGCLIGSRGAVVKEIIRRTNARIVISDVIEIKVSSIALGDITPDPTGYRMVTIKGSDKAIAAADILVRSVIELGAKALGKDTPVPLY